MDARHGVDIGPVPRIQGHRLVLQIGSVPALGSRRLRDQRPQAFLLAGVAADVETVKIESGRQVSIGPVEQFKPKISIPISETVVYAAWMFVPSNIFPYLSKVVFAMIATFLPVFFMAL